MDYTTLQQDDSYLQALPNGVWLMDNHKWALSVWARQNAGTRRWLLHADHHWDGVDLLHEDVHAQQQLLSLDLDALDSWICVEHRIQYDAFIAPAIRRGLFDQVHFFCTQDDGFDKGISAALCDQMGVIQQLHESIESFAAVAPTAPLVLDLCLDLFNKSDMYYQSDLWPEEDILSFLASISHHVKAAEVLTVSLSFGYSGTKADTRKLAALVVPRLLELRA